MPQPRTRWVVGCMTGTSLDGLDAALVKIEGTGLDMRAMFEGMVSKPLAGLAPDLKHLAEGNPAKPIDYLRAARSLGELHADAVDELLANKAPGSAGGSVTPHTPHQHTSPPARKRHESDTRSARRENATNDDGSDERRPTTDPPAEPGAFKIDFVVAHGQTIWHAPRDDVGRLSWQLFDPWPIVHRLNVPVCYDLRQADLIAGGEGAPITPIADWVMYRSDTRDRTIANLGGVCNVTYLFGGREVSSICASDVGLCNLLIDPHSANTLRWDSVRREWSARLKWLSRQRGRLTSLCGSPEECIWTRTCTYSTASNIWA